MQNSHQLKSGALFVAVMALALLPRTAFGQEQKEEHGSVEIGVRQVWGEVYGRPDLPFQPFLSTSRFEEYQHLPNGFFVKSFESDLNNFLGRNLFLEAHSRGTLQNDQSYLLSFGQRGKFKLQFRYDETPHIFNNTSRMLFNQVAPGVFFLPPATRTMLAKDGALATCSTASVIAGTCTIVNDLNSLYAATTPFDPHVQRNKATIGSAWTPTPNWALGFTYGREQASGTRPLSTAASVEFSEPVEYVTHAFKANAEYGRNQWGLQAGYDGSLFNNDAPTLMYDNPYPTAGDLNANPRGRIALYPNNSARAMTFAGAFDLSRYVRIMASITPGWQMQNRPFLPYGVNPYIAGDTNNKLNLCQAVTNGPTGPCDSTAMLPAQSLHGSKATLAMNYTAASKPVKNVAFVARFRSYDDNNDTPSILFPGYVSNDGASFKSGAGNSRESIPYSFSRKEAEFSGSWQFLKNDFVKVGYNWERYDREHRDVSRTGEGTVFATLDLNPNKATLFRLSYRHSNRTPSAYENNVENFGPLGEGDPTKAVGQPEFFRRFDETGRVRDRAEALLQYSPTQTLSFSASYGTDQKKYDNRLSAPECAALPGGSVYLGYGTTAGFPADYNTNPACLAYGVQNDISYDATFDVTYSPTASLSIFGEYSHEKYNMRHLSRWMTDYNNTTKIPIINSPNNDWASSSHDLVDTWAAGLDVYTARKRVTITTFYSLSAAQGSILTAALGNAGITSGADTFLVTGYNLAYPDTTNRLHQVSSIVKFKLSKNLFPKFEYRFQQYDQVDFQTSPMRSYMANYDPTNTSYQKFLFLGADTPSYRAHYVAASLEYHF